MAIAILDGELGAAANSDWVAVPGSALYTIQFNGVDSGALLFSISNDGMNEMVINASGRITNISGGGLSNRTVAVSNTPVAFMRVTNNSASPVTAKVYVQSIP